MPVRAQSSELLPAVEAVRLAPEDRIVLDGVLSEPIWKRTAPATDFRQQEPGEGAPPTEQTEVHVAFDDGNLYIGAMLHDSDPSGIRGYQRRRDAGLGSDDRFMWILDTFLDGRSAYFFEINPQGLLGDGLMRAASGNTLNKSWDGIWDVQVARHDQGWSAEIRIPFRTLNFDPTLDAWGINFQRTIRRRNEELLWSGWRRNQGLFRPVNAGRLTGLTGLSQGIGLEARPYVSGGAREAGGVVDGTSNIGFDLGYSITPGLRAALTVNTDFAETDVDDRQVNLTRFPLFFPERRQFFLEGSSVYTFAPASGINPFFSRRIGLAAGQAIPITYGARLGGQAGAFDLGFLQVRTGREGAQPSEQFTVGRVRRNVFAQSSIGVIYTRRATERLGEVDLPDRHTLGFDLDLSTARFLGNKNLQFEAFFVGHTVGTRDETTTLGDRSTRGFRLNYPNDIWQAHVSFREFGDAWDPAVGFAPRRGFRRVQPTVSWNPRPLSSRLVRQYEFEAYFEHLADLGGVLETRRASARPLGVRFNSGDRLNVTVANQHELLKQPFQISNDIALAPGGYSFNDVTVDLSSASQRRVSAGLEVQRGEFWSGRRTRLAGDVTLRPRPGLQLSGFVESQDVTLPEGEFSTLLYRLTTNWDLSPWASVTNNLQYDDVSGLMGLNARLRWIVRPGSDFFVVYAHNWSDMEQRLATVSRGITTKINYTHRF
ncbi:MAG: carbohydrate binding family 9 domain-containing protein [Acidobacteria bacterium]|nr:carbohydrate binding family 9 domain-containing protein [Acidobacteriota bacterium]